MRHMKPLLLSMLILTLIGFVSMLGLQAQDQTNQCNTLRAEIDDNHLISFIRPDTGEVVRQEQMKDDFWFSYFPDCRFIRGQSRGYNCLPGMVIWDANSGEPLQVFNHEQCRGGRTLWKPDNTAVFMWRSGIWHPDRNHLVRLDTTRISQAPYIWPNFEQVYWDDHRRWVWISSNRGVIAFNIESGAQTANYFNPFGGEQSWRATDSSFTFSPDHSKVIVHGQDTWNGYTNPGLSVYDIETGNGLAVNPELNGAGNVAMSPDNRYLVMTYTAVRVWDLHNLPEAVEDRLPVYRFGLPYLGNKAYFEDNTTLVAESGTSGTILRWNLETGQPIE